MAYNFTACQFLLIVCLVLVINSAIAVSDQGQGQPERSYEGCLEKCRNMETSSVWDVACTNYGLESIPSEAECRPAAVLDLKKNVIKEIRRGDFTGFVNLEFLLLNDNKITDISPGAFADLDKLESLEMDRNNLTVLRRGVFIGLNHLQLLSITDNQIPRITARNVFNTLTDLQELFLSGNMIESIQVGSLDGMAKLTYLRLERNRITTIASGTFARLAELKFLDLSENRITLLEDGAFRGLRKLETLKLNSNAITVVSSIADLPRLNTLQLADNEIESLGGNQFLRDKLKLQTFAITAEENPLRCNCSNEPLRLWYRSRDSVPDQAMCQEPSEYAGKLLVDVDKALLCPKDGVANNTSMDTLGNKNNNIGNDPNTHGPTIAVIMILGVIVLLVAVFIVVRKYRQKIEFFHQGVAEDAQTEIPDRNAMPVNNVANGYHTMLPDNDDRTTVQMDMSPPPPPSAAGHFFAHQTTPDETSDLLAPAADAYLSVNELNPKPPPRPPPRAESQEEDLHHWSPLRASPAPEHQLQPSTAAAPRRSSSLDPETVCEIDFSGNGPVVFTPGPMFHEDESSGDQDDHSGKVQYAQLDHSSILPRDTTPRNMSECYIQPSALMRQGLVT